MIVPSVLTPQPRDPLAFTEANGPSGGGTFPPTPQHAASLLSRSAHAVWFPRLTVENLPSGIGTLKI